ncbi:hypothetical protein M569_03184, partial [Genlisea aurea]
GLIDLNTVNDEDDDASLSASPESTTRSLSEVCMELWHACAGPLISLPKKGTPVVYFPQGHLELLPEHSAVAYDLPPHIFCRVLDVKLHADADNDEVYARVSLIPDHQIEHEWREGMVEPEAEDEDPNSNVKAMTPHMFCKTLTASDTSTHGGFSVPRRAAEDCFPPLDYKQQRPSQELVAKDLHGTEWKFRHIYRGQPRRHLLTTGWSAFVNKKKLVSGDAVLFLRHMKFLTLRFTVNNVAVNGSGDGELRLGIRRAVQVKSGGASSVLALNSQLFNSCISTVANALSARSTFEIFYNPRARSSDIIVSYGKFARSLMQSFSCGMRFKVPYETEESSERRNSGVIVGVSDVDPSRWSCSKWKCLQVRWDDLEVNCIDRVSPWEIELTSPVSGGPPPGFALAGTKRNRIGFSATAKPDHLPPGFLLPDFREASRYHKVLQGQEIFNFRNRYPGGDGRRCYSGLRIGPFDESFQFQKVLQGQET